MLEEPSCVHSRKKKSQFCQFSSSPSKRRSISQTWPKGKEWEWVLWLVSSVKLEQPLIWRQKNSSFALPHTIIVLQWPSGALTFEYLEHGRKIMMLWVGSFSRPPVEGTVTGGCDWMETSQSECDWCTRQSQPPLLVSDGGIFPNTDVQLKWVMAQFLLHAEAVFSGGVFCLGHPFIVKVFNLPPMEDKRPQRSLAARHPALI